MPSVSISLEGAAETSRALRAAGERLEKPLRPLLDAIAAVWQGFFQDTVRSEGQRLETTWPPLRPRTQRERIAQGYGPEHPMLIRKSDLLHSIGLLASSESWVDVGTRMPKASLLQRGGSTGQGGVVPPRPFVGLTQQDVDDTFELIEEYFFGEGASA